MFTTRPQTSRVSRGWRPSAPAGTAVLVVEADDAFASGLAAYLTQEGFAVRVAADGLDGWAAFGQRRPDLVLVNLAIPGINGFDLCRRIRADSDVPIIAMSAKGSELDAVLALEMGADDHVSRTCRARELVARMRAALRRAPSAETESLDGALQVGSVTLDRDRCEVAVDGKTCNLPRKEYRLLATLMGHPGRVFSRRMLISRVWGEDYVGTTKTLDVHIRRLRSKLEDDVAHPTRIVTVRGLGFKFEPPGLGNVRPIHPSVERAPGTGDPGSPAPLDEASHLAGADAPGAGGLPDSGLDCAEVSDIAT